MIMSSLDNQVTPYDDEACINALLLCSSSTTSMVLNTAIELDLFGIIAQAGDGSQISSSEIASQLPTQNPDAPSMVDRMLRLFATRSLLTCSSHTLKDGTIEKLYGLTPVSKFFLPNHDKGCVSPFMELNFHQKIMEVGRHMKDVILEGSTSNGLFEKVHGISMYQYMNKDPKFKNIFNQSMVGFSTIAVSKILDIYKGFEGLTSLVDVGGGTGTCLNMIISRYPSIKGINFDLPIVIQSAPSYQGIQHIGGDMFSNIPNADAIMLKDIIHNWTDEKCIKVLKNCYRVLPNDGKLIIINVMLPEDPNMTSKASVYVSELDNIMLTQVEGKERTTKEFETFCKKVGFSNFQVVCAACGIWSVMEAYK